MLLRRQLQKFYNDLTLFRKEMAGVMFCNAHKENNRAKSERSLTHLLFLFF